MNRLYSKISSIIRGSTIKNNGFVSQITRWQSNNDPNKVTEQQIESILKKNFPGSFCIKVEDVSGGCGAMFNIYIESSDFKGLSIPKQHKSVYDCLREQIKNIHGLHLETKVA